MIWIKLDSSSVAFPEFLEVQDHIWGYGLMFSGLIIAFSIWKWFHTHKLNLRPVSTWSEGLPLSRCLSIP